MHRFLLILTLVLTACNSQSSWDCVQGEGQLVQKEFGLASFDRILVRSGVELILRQEEEQQVVIETGEYLLADISVGVIDGQLIIRDNNTCNLVRDYGLTKAYVSSPNIKEIRNASAQPVSSDGVLNYPEIELISEDFAQEEDGYSSGDFILQVAVQTLRLRANNLSNFFLSGTAEGADFRIFSGDVRIEAQDLTIKDLLFYHRGSNQMIVNPQRSLRGDIYSVGDVISLSRPPEVEVTEYYTGRLIFQD